jgi:hypothetical protein
VTHYKKKILFVTNKYDDKKQLSNLYHNIFATCDASNLFEKRYLFIDELVQSGSHIDYAILNELEYEKADIIVFSYLASTTSMNPSLSIIELVKRMYLDIKLVFLWWDGVYETNRKEIVQLDPFASLHVNFDASDIPTSKSFFCGVPQSNALFYPDEHTNELSFIGRINGYQERYSYIQYLLSNGVNVNIPKEYLTPEGYAEQIRHSDININFCHTACGKEQCKGRVWEILASKTLLLEQYNDITVRYLKDDVHCVFFQSQKDLLDKVNGLIGDREKITEISQNAYDLYQEKYHSFVLWDTIGSLNE